HPANGAAPVFDANRGWGRHRIGRRIRRNTSTHQLPFRREAYGSRNLRRGIAGADHCCADSYVLAGTAGDEGRSDGGVAIRVGQTIAFRRLSILKSDDRPPKNDGLSHFGTLRAMHRGMIRSQLKNWKLNSIAVFSLAIAMALSVIVLSFSNAILLRP